MHQQNVLPERLLKWWANNKQVKICSTATAAVTASHQNQRQYPRHSRSYERREYVHQLPPALAGTLPAAAAAVTTSHHHQTSRHTEKWYSHAAYQPASALIWSPKSSKRNTPNYKPNGQRQSWKLNWDSLGYSWITLRSEWSAMAETQSGKPAKRHT